MRNVAVLTFLLLTVPIFVTCATWKLSDAYQGNAFYQKFTWFTDPDPTYGNVRYVSQNESRQSGLTYVKDGQFFMAVSTNATVQNARPSVRITSKVNYTDGVYVLNASHIPVGCAVWPAFWTVTSNINQWPEGGEIDIVENANDMFNGSMAALHTKGNCAISGNSTLQTGSMVQSNCSAYTPNNEGCVVIQGPSSTPSWGPAVNAAKGGIYAMQRYLNIKDGGEGIKVWFWNHGKQPADLNSPSQQVNTSTWGVPAANLDIPPSCYSQFGPHNIVFDITLCGAFAGNTYNLTSCSKTYSSCLSQVLNNGSSFSEAYWGINALAVYNRRV